MWCESWGIEAKVSYRKESVGPRAELTLECIGNGMEGKWDRSLRRDLNPRPHGRRVGDQRVVMPEEDKHREAEGR